MLWDRLALFFISALGSPVAEGKAEVILAQLFAARVNNRIAVRVVDALALVFKPALAHDRAHTIRVLASPIFLDFLKCLFEDFVHRDGERLLWFSPSRMGGSG